MLVWLVVAVVPLDGVAALGHKNLVPLKSKALITFRSRLSS